MFCRVTQTNFDQNRYDEILAWAETVREAIEGIDGLLFVDSFNSGPGESILVAAYENEEAFNAASETVTSVFADMGQFLTAEPPSYSGTVDLSYKR